jgi:hypothetical protein
VEGKEIYSMRVKEQGMRQSEKYTIMLILKFKHRLMIVRSALHELVCTK